MSMLNQLTQEDWITMGRFVSNLILIWGTGVPMSDDALIEDIQKAKDFTMGTLPLPEEIDNEP